ncbi:Outer membrane usher protein HtrE precursor [compost metagenome]
MVYDTPVAPGPFAIDDLYPTGYGGDLDVELTEADGRIKRFSVPFSAVPQLLRPGSSRWAITAGEVDEVNLQVSPWLLQGTYERGLTNTTTAYGGSILSEGYHAALLGGAWNTPGGALSADLTQARNRAPGQAATQGVSARLGYNRNFINSGTDFSVAAYRYSTSGFVSLQDAAALRDAIARGQDMDSLRRQRSRMDLSINQMLGEGAGLLFLNGSVRDFWGRHGNETEFSAGYNNSWKSLSYSLSVQRTRDSVAQRDTNHWLGIPDYRPVRVPVTAQSDTRLSFNVSVPLGRTAGAPTATGMFNRSRSGSDSRSLSFAGAAGPEHRLAYGASLGENNSNRAYDLTAQYNGSFSQLAAGYSRGSGYQQLSGGLTGGMVVHGGGVTLAPPLGETIGLIHASDAAGAHVENGQGAKVDRRGYAVVPYLMPYELNTITLDPKGTDTGVEIAETTRRVAPRAGTVVLLRYETRSGRALIIQTRLPDGRPVPFGADVFDAAGNSVGVAGQASRLHINGLQHSGVITVRWGTDDAEQCRINVTLSPLPARKKTDFEQIEAACSPLAAASVDSSIDAERIPED